ncbi:MAG TPA: hypothetical protein VFX53_17105 [Pedococcus sp.]|nr:hypothetical protein [Pedococcus sp.]
MPFDLRRFADAEEVARELLQAEFPSVTVVSATGATIVPPTIIVRRIGGENDFITDFPLMLVSCIGATRPASNLLAAQVQAVIMNAINYAIVLSDGSTALIDGSIVRVADHPEAYDNPDLRVVTGTYELRLRRPKVPA